MPDILDITVPRFFSAVEAAVDSSLRHRPLAVAAPAPGGRGLVLCCSVEAEASGVRRGMMAAEALRRCKGLRLLPPRFSLYRRASTALLEQALAASPRVEAGGAGHLFVDLSGGRLLFGAAEDQATKLRKQLSQATRLLPCLGLSSNKVVSRAASSVAERFGLCSVEPGREQGFLHPLPVGYVMGVGERTRLALLDLNITTAGQLASLPQAGLLKALGKPGLGLAERAQGLGSSDVRPAGSQGRTLAMEKVLAPDSNHLPLLRRALFSLGQGLGLRLRQASRLAEALELALLFSDGVEQSKRLVLAQATDVELEFWPQLDAALDALSQRRLRVARISLTAHARLELSGSGQLSLWSGETKERKLTQALDALRKKPGAGKVCFGLELGRC